MLKRTYRYAIQYKNTSMVAKNTHLHVISQQSTKTKLVERFKHRENQRIFLVVINRGAMLALAKSLLI